MTSPLMLSLLLAAGSTTVHDKFLVDPGGVVVAHLDSGVEPTSADLRKRIEDLLPRR